MTGNIFARVVGYSELAERARIVLLTAAGVGTNEIMWTSPIVSAGP